MLKKTTEEFLYKYRSCECLLHLKEIILENKLYFPRPSELNDPEECKPKLNDSLPAWEIKAFLTKKYEEANRNFPRDVKDMVIKHWESQPKEVLVKNLSEILNHILDSRYRVLSLSKNCSKLALWEKYADRHAGICLEFKNVGVFSKSHDVIYEDSIRMYNPTVVSDIGASALFTKTTVWNYEDEARIVLGQPQYKYFHFPAELLNSVLLGKDISVENREHIINWVSKRTVPLKIKQARFDDSEQCLKFEDVIY